MGNKILGRRSRSFYKGFNQKQIEYLKQKFQTFAIDGKLDKGQFMQAFKMDEKISDLFLNQMDFDEDSSVDQYEFICMVHSLCSFTIEQLGTLIHRILTKSKTQLTQKNLQPFTRLCLKYNFYINRTNFQQKTIIKQNKSKYQKYNYDRSSSIDLNQFIKMCLKDEDYKKWMYNMGFISKRQLDYQDQVYDLVDSDIGDQIVRHDRQNNENISKIKMGIQHRIGDDQFQIQQQVGQQSVQQVKPWIKVTQKTKIEQQNLQPPSQSLQIEYVFGYRSFDCRNNVKFDSKGRVIYHQAAIGIILDTNQNKQYYTIQHHDDISCLDVVQDTVVTGETGAKPSIIMWDTNKQLNNMNMTVNKKNKGNQQKDNKMIITEQLKDGISCVCLAPTKGKLAVICNDTNHKLVVYDCQTLWKKQANPTCKQKSIIAFGNTTTNIPFDLKFDITQKTLVLATLKQLVFISFEKGKLNANRGIFGNFTVSAALCLQPLKSLYKGETKNYMLAGMGNGSIYLWQKENCVKALSGHSGSVSSICARKDKSSFVSGDRSGNIIIWNEKFQKQKTITVPKSNATSTMIVSLSCSQTRQLLVGTKGSDIYLMRLGDSFDRAKKVMSGHCEGQLCALAVHRTQNYIYTGGQDQRLIKWQYIKKKTLQKQRKCPYPIRSIDLYNNEKLNQNLMVVGYKNGVVQLFDPQTLDSLDRKYTGIKNPDQQVLNLVRINKDGDMCIVCYQFPKFKIVLLNLAKKDKKTLDVLSQIPLTSKLIAVDFDKQSKYIRFNTANYQYLIYNIDDFKKPTQVKKIDELKPNHEWATHTLPYSPETKGIYSQGVVQSDIVCCERSRKYNQAFVVGDKFSKIKLFSYPSKQNKIYNKYVGHSNQVTGLQFNRNNSYLISIGGEQKSIIVWKYNYVQSLKNQWLLKKFEQQSDMEEQISQQRKKKKKLLQEYQCQQVLGQKTMAVKAFAGQIKYPSDFKQNYNTKIDNKLPDQSVSIKHVFGLRNKYINDQVRKQVMFTSDFKSIVFPTACLGVKMSIDTREQEFYHAHREDIVSFAIDPTRKLMATGQMAQKNPASPLKKIVSIYVWDIGENKILNKLDGFHTIAVVLLSFSPNSKLLYSCGNDQKNTFAIYDWMSGSILYSGPTSRAKVNGITWKTNQQFMTCGMDHVKFWTGPKSQMGRIQGKASSMYSCASSKNIYITGNGEGGIYNWIGNKSSKKINAHEGKVQCLVFFNDYVYSGGDEGVIKAWRTQANGEVKSPQQFFDTRAAYQQLLKTVKNIPQQQFGVLSIDFSQKKQLLVGTLGASVIYFNGKRSQVIHQGHYKGQLWGLATQISKNNDRFIATGCDDKSIRIWDVESYKQITRVYFQNKIRGIDWSSDGSRIVVADSRAKIHLFNSTLTNKLDQYIGKPYEFNKNQKIDPFVQDIKFSPDNKMIVYGCHGKSLYMQILNVDGKLKKKQTFEQGSSALLHVDWGKNSDIFSINSQAYQLIFFGTNGKQVQASATADQKWATWTRKIGFQVKGIFQGVDYSDVNTVCRDPNSKFIAVGYDDQYIRLFKYPCYIDKQVCKIYPGHSSHVTRIKFTSNYMISLGGLDRTIILWNIERPQLAQKHEQQQQYDGLDHLEQDVDLPKKAVTRKPKPKQIQQFYQIQDEGDQFMAVKPWLGAIKQPTYKYPQLTSQKPNVQLKLQYVHGYRVKDCRQNLYYNDSQHIIYHAAAVLIYHDITKNQQIILDPHHDDILSIDYHRKTNQVITGQLGPKPLVCLFKDGKLDKTFIAPVKKGILAIAISPDGRKAVCAGMNDDHTITVLDLQSGKVLATAKGTKKVITRLVWTSATSFVSVGICHYKLWTFEKDLKGNQTPNRYNFVSAVCDQRTKKVYAGASKGTIVIWNGSTQQKEEISLTRAGSQEEKQDEKMPASVVQCLLIQKNLLLAGTKDGFVYVIDIQQAAKVLNQIQMQQQFSPQSLCPAIRSLYILQNKLLVGTLGSQIYEFQFKDLSSKKLKLLNCKNLLRCHYSPNNTWTNQVWGLHVHDDYIFTCSDDATVRCWSIMNRKLISLASTNQYKSQKGQVSELQKDKKTKDFSDASKARCVSVSPDGKQVIVGCKNGTVRVYQFSEKSQTIKFKDIFRHAKEWISDIKFGYKTLIIGSHDNAIYVYNYDENGIKRKYAPLKKHSSYITHLDISRDSCFLQSTCGAYQLLFWDLNTGKQITAGATLLRDQRWATWTCNLGWPVQGIYPKCQDGTFINSVDRSHLSINNTLDKDDVKSPSLLAAGNDNGKVCLYNYPSLAKSSKFVQGKGHSSHVTNVRWNKDDRYVISVGGEDQCLMMWRVIKKK